MSSEEPGTLTEGDSPEAAGNPSTGSVETSSNGASSPWRRAFGWFGRLSWWQEGLVLALVAVLVAIVLKTFVVQTYSVTGASMEPLLSDGDRMVVERFGGDPQRGDVVVFEDPGGWLGSGDAEQGPVTTVLSHLGLYPTGGHLVKRVIGVEGDVITCCTDGKIVVNGLPLEEDYIAELGENDQCNGPMISTCDWSAGPVPAGTVFVMGDNRAASDDSTVHLCQENETDCTRDPFVDLDLVVGTVVGVAWPADAWTRLSRPSVFDDVPDPG